MKKFLIILISVTFLISCFCFNASALTISDTYSDVASTASQATNLINLACKYTSFVDSDYVIFCDEQYSYYIVWGDLQVDNTYSVTGSDIEYIRYYRSGSSGSYSYYYLYGTDSTFSLNCSNVCTSNLDDFGMRSAVYDEWKTQHESISLLILACSFFFVMTLIGLRSK